MLYHTLFLSKIGKELSQNLSSAAVVIGALRVPNQPIVTLYFEFEIVLKFYNLKA